MAAVAAHFFDFAFFNFIWLHSRGHSATGLVLQSGWKALEAQIMQMVLQQSSSSSLWLRGGALHADDASAVF